MQLNHDMQLNKARKEDGFVLVVALLALVLLGAVVATFNTSLRAHLKDVGAIVARAEVEGLADAGVNIALLDVIATLEDRTRTRRFPMNGAAVSCQTGSATIDISVVDEAGRIDLNAADEQLLVALFAGAGAESSAARAMANALIDYRDADTIARPNGAEVPEYRAAGLAYGPKNAPLDAVEEMSRVLNFDVGLLDRLHPYLTVHSGLAGVDPEAAPLALLLLLLNGSGHSVVDGAGMDAVSQRARFRQTLPQYVAVSSRLKFTIRAVARLPGAAFVREAVVDVSGSRARSYTIRAWRQGVATASEAEAGQNLPAC